jgi:chromosome segregation ATPase
MDDLKKLLNETRAELKTAQDRKAELAMQNEKLSGRVAELEKTNQAQAAQLEELKRKAAGFADRTLFLSTQYAAWQQFLNANPAVKRQWVIFEDTLAAVNIPEAGGSALFMDPDWPLSARE